MIRLIRRVAPRREVARPVFAAALALFAGAGCLYQRIVPAGVQASSRPLKPIAYKILGNETAVASNYDFFGLLGLTPEANLDLAVAEAVNRRGGDALIDLRYEYEKQIWWIGTVHIYRASGRVIQYETGAKPAEAKP